MVQYTIQTLSQLETVLLYCCFANLPQSDDNEQYLCKSWV